MYECHIIIDFEFNPVMKNYRNVLRDEIVEIGAIKLNPQFEEIGRFSCLVKPQMNTIVEPKITKLTTIRTSDVMNAVDFSEAINMLSEWIGTAKARIYSWSDNDLRQLEDECYAKDVTFPENMMRWMDLQKVFQRIIHYPSSMCIGLHYAANMLQVSYDDKSAHRALYDAFVTSKILTTVKSDEYKQELIKAKDCFVPEQRTSTYTISSACGDMLLAFMKNMATV